MLKYPPLRQDRVRYRTQGRTLVGPDTSNAIYVISCFGGLVGANVLARYFAGGSTLIFIALSTIFMVLALAIVISNLYYVLSPLYQRWEDKRYNRFHPSK